MQFQSISVAYGKRLRHTLDHTMPTTAYVPKQVAYASLLKVISCIDPFMSKKLSSSVALEVLKDCLTDSHTPSLGRVDHASTLEACVAQGVAVAADLLNKIHASRRQITMAEEQIEYL